VYTSHPIAELTPGTAMEIARGNGITEIAVVICTKPLMLRKATAYEAFLFWFKSRKTRAGEITAAVQAVDAIEKAKAYAR
jgi:hypothetical protein